MPVKINTYDLFRYIEENFDIEKLQYKGVNFWPLIRSRVAYQMLLGIPSEDYKVVPKKRSMIDRIKWPYRKLKLDKLKHKFENSVHGLEEKIQVFVFPDRLFIDEISNKKYSRYVDPYYEIILGMNVPVGRFSLLINGSEIAEPLHPVNYLNTDHFLQYIGMKRFLNGYNERDAMEVEKIKSVFAELNNLCENKFAVRPFFASLISEFDQVFEYKLFFDQVFERSKAKLILLECFYDAEKMALCASAREHSIQVIEIQHGVISDHSYQPYLNHKIRYKILPDHLWCWAESDKNKIIKENGAFEYLKPFTGGNMWLKKYMNGEIGLPNENELELFVKLKKRFKKLVLFAQQPLIECEQVFEAIKRANDVLFFFRFHPMTLNDEREKIKQGLRDQNNVDFENASKLNLYTLFRHCDLQITHSSATAIEALSFDLPTVVCGKNGSDYYKEEIENGVVFYADKAEVLSEYIYHTPRPEQGRSNYYKIKASEEEARRNLDILIRKCAA